MQGRLAVSPFISFFICHEDISVCLGVPLSESPEIREGLLLLFFN